MDTLTVRVYNVRFGDAILVQVPDRAADGTTTLRHILIDVGNATATQGGENAVFAPVIDDILAVLAGRPLDLYVMTHEHMDHVQGLLWAAKNHVPDLVNRLAVRHAWLTASAAEDYYDTHAEARRQLEEATAIYTRIHLSLEAAKQAGDVIPDALAVLLRNNNRFLPDTAADALGSTGSTASCVRFLRGLAGAGATHFVSRSVGAGAAFDPAGKHPFDEARFEIWGPEEDTSVYYGQFQPLSLGLLGAGGAEGGGAGTGITRWPLELHVRPPAGVDASAFYTLARQRDAGMRDNLLAIDRAANNTSIVFMLEWRGWRLLFPGDAEVRAWREMNKHGVLKPVDFLKVSHHASHNGTPEDDLLDQVFPPTIPGAAPTRTAVVTTYPGVYDGIPDCATAERLATRHGCTVYSTMALNDQAVVDQIQCPAVTIPQPGAPPHGGTCYTFAFDARGA